MSEIVVARNKGSLAVVTETTIEVYEPTFFVADRCASLKTSLPPVIADLRAARIVRAALAPEIKSVCDAAAILADMLRDHPRGAVKKDDAARMLGRLYGGVFSSKRAPDDVAALLVAAVEMVTEGDAVLRAIGLAPPPRHEAILGLAVKRLIATCVFAPAPSELREALFKVRDRIILLQCDAQAVLGRARSAERILFEQARGEWAGPYRSGALPMIVADYLADAADAEWQAAVDDLFESDDDA